MFDYFKNIFFLVTIFCFPCSVGQMAVQLEDRPLHRRAVATVCVVKPISEAVNQVSMKRKPKTG